jgi:hypothetical protein
MPATRSKTDRPLIRLLIIVAPLLLLTGCGSGSDDRTAPGTLTASQEQELNDAAAALDANQAAAANAAPEDATPEDD